MSAVAEPVVVRVEDAPKPRPFYAFNARYTVEPGAKPDALLDDAGCWLEAISASVNNLAMELGSRDSTLQANPVLAGRMAWGAYHMIEMVRGAVEAAQVAMLSESNRDNAA
ncbi:hypothetical protein [Frateuria soli]|uniref:hypothetical protein n=1 Tax=Frateuria soli TaxID=1542730 RepID=UPI001E2F36FA|nr:hypothetical protein [Frateuria soli]UGB39118.1 hypothetical protein LQ771_04540 [Frateuria soli]